MAGHWSLRGYGIWAIEDKSSGAFIGWCRPLASRRLARTAKSTGPRRRRARAGLGDRGGVARARSTPTQTLGWPTAISLIALANRPRSRSRERLGARLGARPIYRGFETGVFRHPARRPKSPPIVH